LDGCTYATTTHPMPDKRLQNLLEKYQAGTCTPEELEELENWFRQLSATDQPFVEESSQETEQIKEEMLLHFRRRLAIQDKPVVPMPGRNLGWRIVAAAAVLVVVSIAIFYLTRTGTKQEAAAVKNNIPVNNGDVLPGGNHATLTLADGTSILLDTAKHGGLAQQGISAIHKPVDGLLVYEPTETSAKDDAQKGMNLVRTPRGGQYQVQLPDGSKVWLNAASSIEFPVSFAGSERRVTITGEVYFEVKKQVTASGSKQSFIVQVADKGEVEVLGTHFNVNAYDDEAAIKTTLLEGSVIVRNKTNQSKIISPGQQARISNGSLSVISEADLEEAVAWKNGLFKFNDADIQAILRQAARWYDIEVEVRGNDSGERFRGKIARDVKLSEFLRILEVNQVSFQLQGKKIIIQH
jgi:transmembrane sensor